MEAFSAFLASRDAGDWAWLLSLPLIALAIIYAPALYYRWASWRVERKLAQSDMLFADERIELAMSVPEKPEPLSWKSGVLGALALALFWFALEFTQWRGLDPVWVFGPIWGLLLATTFYRWARDGFPVPTSIPAHIPQNLARVLICSGGLLLLALLMALLGLF